MSELVRVSIIGTAGRKDDANRMTAALFDQMCAKALDLITSDLNLDIRKVVLVSGGAAWSDHVAVKLFISSLVKVQQRTEQISEQNNEETKSFAGLNLHLPCGFDSQLSKAVDNGSFDWRMNPGRLMNRLHSEFGSKLGYSTLEEIPTAVELGAQLCVYPGFHARNRTVSSSPYCIAFSWSKTNEPDDGGTKFTWKLCKGQKVHVSLHDFSTSKQQAEIPSSSVLSVKRKFIETSSLDKSSSNKRS